jgi:NADP-dependent 3-hydroxy acid dehydrogenase YdfG
MTKDKTKIALVTGASRGLGKNTVLSLVKKGVDAIVTYHNSDEEAKSVVSAFAVWAISEGLRQESTDIRVTVISPGVRETELANTITDAEAAEWVEGFREAVIPADAIARAIAFAIEQPAEVDVNEIIVRPIGQMS